MNTKQKTQQQLVRVMIVDDHPTLREGLGSCIESQADMTVCGEAADVDEALRKVAECPPDVAIVDIALKHSDGLELVKSLRVRHKNIRILVHSMYEESVYADRCLHAGALGYVTKEAEPDEVVRAIRTVHRGKVYLSTAMTSSVLGRAFRGEAETLDPIETLTDRQLEVFRLTGQGLTASQIAKRLHISVHTVETHRENIKRKLDVTSASELTRLAVLWGDKTKQ
jgi:DNA-binding NarL/FixJ family response regulator